MAVDVSKFLLGKQEISNWTTHSSATSYTWWTVTSRPHTLFYAAQMSVVMQILSQSTTMNWTTVYKHFDSSLDLHDVIWHKSHLRHPDKMLNSFLKTLFYTWDHLSPKLLPCISRFMPFVIQVRFLNGPTALDIPSWKKHQITLLLELRDDISFLYQNAIEHKLHEQI